MLSCFHAAGRVDPYWSAGLVTISTAIPASVATLASHHRSPRRSLPRPRRLPALALLAFAGAAGDVAYGVASRHGALSVISAISSLYPVSTILLGVLARRQRTRPIQSAGIALALVGAALLGAAAH